MKQKELVIIAEGRLDLRDEGLYLDNKPLISALAMYADGHITVCISKDRKAARRRILDKIFVEGRNE